MTLNVDPELLAMFVAEVETHMAALNDGLLALEQNPDQSSRFEELMRAAHSIKGAAKLVGLHSAVEVAHVIEDSFVAAREGRLAMTSSLVDVLLEGVDLLGRATDCDAPDEQRVSTGQIAATVARIQQASAGNPASPPGRAPQTPAAVAADAATSLSPSADYAPQGLLDESWVNRVHKQFAADLQSGTGNLELALAGVTEIEPLALAFLALVVQRADATTQRLTLLQVPARFARLLTAVGLDGNAARENGN